MATEMHRGRSEEGLPTSPEDQVMTTPAEVTETDAAARDGAGAGAADRLVYSYAYMCLYF